MRNLLLYLFSCAATIFFVKILDYPARRFGLVDIPCGRKNHSGAVPLTGGLAMFFAIVLTVLSHSALGSAYASLVPALMLLVVTGACDDLLDLSAGSRFVAQAIAALLMIALTKVAIVDLGDLFGNGAVRLDEWSVPFTLFCMVGVINSINMLDGIDGLAGGVVFVVFIVFGGAASISGNISQATLLFVLAGAVAGFAAFNMRSPWRPCATVFMGDSGSMMLGLAAAWFAIDLTSSSVKAFSPITAVWILAVPILDTVSLMLRRILKGRSPFAPDHGHLHHIFLQAGFSVSQTVALIVSLSLAFGLVGLGGWYFGVPDYVMFYVFLFIFLLYFFSMLHAWRLMKVARKVHEAVRQS